MHTSLAVRGSPALFSLVKDVPVSLASQTEDNIANQGD